MENPILCYLRTRMGVRYPNALWLLTLLSVLPADRFLLCDWNAALSAVAGRNIFCPSYKTLIAYLQRMTLGI